MTFQEVEKRVSKRKRKLKKLVKRPNMLKKKAKRLEIELETQVLRIMPWTSR